MSVAMLASEREKEQRDEQERRQAQRGAGEEPEKPETGDQVDRYGSELFRGQPAGRNAMT